MWSIAPYGSRQGVAGLIWIRRVQSRGFWKFEQADLQLVGRSDNFLGAEFLDGGIGSVLKA